MDTAEAHMCGTAGQQARGDLRQLWQMVTRVEPGQNLDAAPAAASGSSIIELKRVIESLPLETSAVAAMAPRLEKLDAPQFSALLTELARDNHAFRFGPPLCLHLQNALLCLDLLLGTRLSFIYPALLVCGTDPLCACQWYNR